MVFIVHERYVLINPVSYNFFTLKTYYPFSAKSMK